MKKIFSFTLVWMVFCITAAGQSKKVQSIINQLETLALQEPSEERTDKVDDLEDEFEDIIDDLRDKIDDLKDTYQDQIEGIEDVASDKIDALHKEIIPEAKEKKLSRVINKLEEQDYERRVKEKKEAQKKKEHSTASTTNGSDWDEILDEYEDMIEQCTRLMRKYQNGDVEAMSEYVEYMESAQSVLEKLEDAEDDMSAAQISRMTKIAAKMMEIQ